MAGNGISDNASISPLTPFALKPIASKPCIIPKTFVPRVSVWQIWRIFAIGILFP